jgi:hypothetical protein
MGFRGYEDGMKRNSRGKNCQFLIADCRLGSRLVVLALVGLLTGCSSSPSASPRTAWDGPQTAQKYSTESWSFHGLPGSTLHTAHYNIHSTIQDPDYLNRLAQTMEGALMQYQKLCPQINVNDGRPMECFIFAKRPEWAVFTREHTGNDASVYLQINKGGYTIRDWYVAYDIGLGTYAVAAHEGWHQFDGRFFKGRLPPFLEEGIATTFENIQWSGDLPRWNLNVHPNRAQRLRSTIESGNLWPLEKLVSMHAGDVVGLKGEQIEAFYAQNWAFARFLWDGQNGKFRPAFQRLLADTAQATIYDPTGHGRGTGADFRNSKAVLEHYLGMDFPKIEEAYRLYVQQVAFDRFNEQWQQGF